MDCLSIRSGTQLLLDAREGIEVVGLASNGREAVALAHQKRPDVCLLDIRMPEMDGIEATRLLAGPDVPDPIAVVIITTFDLDELVHQALQAGARGFVLKDVDTDLLVRALHAAASGDALIAPEITGRLLNKFTDAAQSDPSKEPIDALTEREEELVVSVAKGRTNAEIADELHISLGTVKAHVGNLMRKLAVRNRVEVVIWAYETGRIETET